MKRNVANWERLLRLLSAGAMLGYAALGGATSMMIVALVVGALYMGATALAGSCLGYRLMGFSTCPVRAKGSPA